MCTDFDRAGLFLGLSACYLYSSTWSQFEHTAAAEHSDQRREPVSLAEIIDQTPRGSLITRRQTISLPLLSSALILASTAHHGTQMQFYP